MDCTHCYVDGSGDGIAIELLERIAAYAKGVNSSALYLTGGEPTLPPRFSDILNILAGKDLAFGLVSNGWNFADMYPALEAHRSCLERIDFSVDGATEHVHDAACTRGSYRRLLQATSVCRARAIPFGLRTTLTQRNIRQMEEITLLAAKLGAEEIAFIPLLPTPRAASENLLLLPEDLSKILAGVRRLRAIFKIKVTLTVGCPDADQLVPCPTLALASLFITARGNVSFCCHLTDFAGANNETDVIANLNELPLDEARRRMASTVAEFKEEKARRIKEGALGPLDHGPCWYCLKHFRKVDWMAEYPDSAWAKDLVATQSTETAQRNEEG